MKEAGAGFAGALRYLWSIVGITLLMLVAVEIIFSTYAWIGRAVRTTGKPVVHREESEAYKTSWAKQYRKEFAKSLNGGWVPYVYHRRLPFDGTYVTVDAQGLRKTWQAPVTDSKADPVDVYMFGGSTMWGTGARNDYTIPSLVAKGLAEKGVSARVTNFGQSGYVSGQGLAALIGELRQGHVPDWVIFYDGANDTYSAYQQRIAGIPQNEYNRAQEFKLSKPERFWQSLGVVLTAKSRQWSSVRALLSLTRQQPVAGAHPFDVPESWGKPAPSDEALAQGVVQSYRGNMEMIEALARHYGFDFRSYWQPTVFNKKSLSAYEQAAASQQARVEPLVREVDEVIDDEQASGKEPEYSESLTHVFEDVTTPLFIDWCHIGENGNDIIADQMLNDILADIRR